MRQHVENQRHRINMLTQQVHDKDDTITDYGKRFKRLEVFPVGEKGGVWGGRYRFADFGVPNGC